MTAGAQTVGVIIPMFNAQQTIGDTLDSVCRQTYPDIDIVVVDDGSVDRSSEIVAARMRLDRRVRLIHQANAGVAAARNRGAAETAAEYLAFVDADDLWAPQKIALQMEALTAADVKTGLVYCWFANIDEAGRTYPLWEQRKIEGNALRDLCLSNYVGNGSSILVRRSAFDAAGGFDQSLHARGAQGCEDLLFCLRVAEHFEFCVIAQYLVGYRQSQNNMSSKTIEMMRSIEIVLDEYRKKYPQYQTELATHSEDILMWFAYRASGGGRLGQAMASVRKLFQSNPRAAATTLPNVIGIYFRSRMVPRPIKAWLRELPLFKARLRPLYIEESW